MPEYIHKNTEPEGDIFSPGSRLLEIRDVVKRYRSGRRNVTAVDNLSLYIDRGEVLGLVGESGCGKSTLARLTVGMERPDRGSIVFGGVDLSSVRGEQLRLLRQGIQMVFQDSGSALNPRMTVGAAVAEPLGNFNITSTAAREKTAGDLLERVGLGRSMADRFPHQLSGGQRQRVGIARALAADPKLMVCDEPVTSLDVSVQAQIINLLLELKTALSLSYLFISHDLAVVYQMCDRVAVMYLGRLVEVLPVERLVSESLHPYTRALVAAVPAENPRRRGYPNLRLTGEAVLPEAGRSCLFAPRCTAAEPRCFDECPSLVEITPGHTVACHHCSGEKPGSS